MGLRDRLAKLLDPTGDASTATFCDCEDPARGDAVPPGCERPFDRSGHTTAELDSEDRPAPDRAERSSA